MVVRVLDDELDEVLRALAHPTRRWIVVRCRHDWVAAGTLTDELALAPATVSEHLKVLRKTGLVELQTDGAWRRYRTRLGPWRHAVTTVNTMITTNRKAPS